MFVEQCMNGVQLGLLLFLLAAGLSLVFGIMNLVNLAHGSLYMIGAYLAVTFSVVLDSFFLGLLAALAGTLVLGIVLDLAIFRRLYGRDHLDHVLATFGLVFFFNEAVRLIWGPDTKPLPVPEALSGWVELIEGIPYPAYRLLIIVVGLAVAAMLYLLVQHTRIGALIRAGASDRETIGALGINVNLLYTLVFGIGACLAALAGTMAAPLTTVHIGMGENILILAFVVIVIGGIGSVKGAFVAALMVGIIDTLGRAYLPGILQMTMSRAAASAAGPGLSAMLIYLMMAVVLIVRPAGMFPAPGAHK
ncbi:MAG: ABC transporter permease [Kaistia sp. SCN 65-12]|nr:MAG: ABC transporter permease [Kaistia sp. SCN 65-12]